jgi:uncharacterized protein (DUF362 family)
MSVSARSTTSPGQTSAETLPSVKTAVIRGDTAGDALAGAAGAAGLLDVLDLIRAARGYPKEMLRIAVKLDLAYPVDAGSGTAIVTGPEVALALAGILQGAGYSQIQFVESRVASRGAQAVPLAELARRHGYPADFAERLVDMVDDPVEVDLGSTVGKEVVGRAWLDADARIVLGKNRTHSHHLIWGTFGALLGCYARVDRFEALREGRRAPALSAVLLNARLPAHFAFLDAWVSGDGSAGDLHPGRPNQTRAVLASPAPLGVDWLAGEMMGLDPGLAPFLREAMLRHGVLHLQRIGNLTPWAPWKNVSLLGAALAQVLAEPRTSGRPEVAT